MVIDEAVASLKSSQSVRDPDETLILIADLRKKLNRFPKSTPEECWVAVEAIESCLQGNPLYNSKRRVLVQRLKSAVSDIIAAHWEDVRIPAGLATPPLSALERRVRRE